MRGDPECEHDEAQFRHGTAFRLEVDRLSVEERVAGRNNQQTFRGARANPADSIA